MGDTTKGLYRKYHVERLDGNPIKGDIAIVLEVGDPNAWPALRTWADTVEAAGYSDLAALSSRRWAMPEPRAIAPLVKPVWRRCVCDQFGRCLADCPSADLVRPFVGAYWDRRHNEWVKR